MYMLHLLVASLVCLASLWVFKPAALFRLPSWTVYMIAYIRPCIKME